MYLLLCNELPKVNSKRRTVVDNKKGQLLYFQTEFFLSLYTRKRESWNIFTTRSKDIVTTKINQLTQLLLLRGKKISEEEVLGFQREMNRIHRLCDLLTYVSSVQYRMLSEKVEIREIKLRAEKLIYSPTVFDASFDSKMVAILDELKEHIRSSMEISREERVMINNAMKSSFNSVQRVGHWFKCRNGHVYCITECGGAMEKAVCPEAGCGAQIGGSNHALLRDQELASEMDGARHAAWSDQNNMANFGFLQ